MSQLDRRNEDLGHIEADKAIARLEHRFREIYRVANHEVQEQMDEYLKRFAKQDEQKLKQLHEGKITQEEYKRWYYNRVLAGKRWQERLNTMANHYVNANVEATAAINHELPRVYADNFNYSAYLTEQQVQADLSFQLVDQWTVERLARDRPELLPKPSVDIPKDQRWNKQKIMSAITQGIVQGDSIKQIARRLQKVTDMNSASATRNARTAVTGAECAGRVDSYQEAERRGVQMVQEWMATLDGRTRHSHAVLDGERIVVGGKFSNGCRYPGDPSGAPSEIYNCRCTIVGRVKGYEAYHKTRWIENGKEQQGAGSKYGTGKLKGESYSEWKERHEAALNKQKSSAKKQTKGINTTPEPSFMQKKEKIWDNEQKISELYEQKKAAEFKLITSNDVAEAESAKAKVKELEDTIQALKQENATIQKNLGLPTNARERFYDQSIDVSSLPQDIRDDSEFGAIDSWTRNDYVPINSYLRHNNLGVHPDSIENAKVLQDMIDRNVVQEAFTVRRGTDTNAMNHLFGGDGWKNPDYPAGGKTITDKGFVATTPEIHGGFGGDVQMFIDVPKGAKGIYLGDYSAAPSEKEFLLQCGTKFSVEKIETKLDKWGEPHYDVFLKVIV